MPMNLRVSLLAGMAAMLPLAVSAAGLLSIAPDALALRQQHGSAPLVIDVRSEAEYASGHVPGAILVPHDQIQAHLEMLASVSGQEVVLYCRSGHRAALAEAQLRTLGVTNLRQLQGHWQGWESSGLPTQVADAGALR